MRVVVVFCEGPHDIQFAARSVLRHRRFERYEGTAQGLPTPFGWRDDPLSKEVGLVRSQRERTEASGAKFEALNFGEKPLFELACQLVDKPTDWQGPDWLLLVNMGGDSSSGRVIELAKTIVVSMKRPRQDTTEFAMAFLFDADPLADKKGLDWRQRTFKETYAPLLGELGSQDWTHGMWSDTAAGRVGLWVHHDSSIQEGTLEDHLGKMFEDTESHKAATIAAKAYIDANAGETSSVRTRSDRRWKAAMTIAGQVVRPAVKGSVVGSGLNVMVEKSLPDEAFDAEVCKELATFLTSAWTTP